MSDMHDRVRKVAKAIPQPLTPLEQVIDNTVLCYEQRTPSSPGAIDTLRSFRGWIGGKLLQKLRIDRYAYVDGCDVLKLEVHINRKTGNVVLNVVDLTNGESERGDPAA